MTKYVMCLMVILFLVVLILFVWKANNDIQITRLIYYSRNRSLNHDISLVHLSDLHNKLFGKNQERLIKSIQECRPDFVCITGDIVDNHRYQNVVIFLRRLTGIAPVFYVTGNHEYMAGNYVELQKVLEKNGVNIVCDSMKRFRYYNCFIDIFGVDDPYSLGLENDYEQYMQFKLDSLMKDYDNQGDLRILLSHRPELFFIYDTYDFDIVLCGHAHGGQFRLPNGQGIIAPNQGLFPKFTQGVITGKRITEIISRGLGNSVVPLRVNNRPEIIVVKICSG